MMNKSLEQFLDMIVIRENALQPDNYITSRKINDENLVLTVGYLNGAAFISGVAFDKLIKIRFNVFEGGDCFYVNVDGVDSFLPLVLMNVKLFFTKGTFFAGTLFEGGYVVK